MLGCNILYCTASKIVIRVTCVCFLEHGVNVSHLKKQNRKQINFLLRFARGEIILYTDDISL